MKLVTANIGRKSSVAGVWSDVRKVKNAAPGAIVGWQEIDEGDPADEHRILRKVLRRANRLIGMRTKVPISLPRRRYRVLEKRIVFAAKGIPHVSPTRWVVETLVQDKRNAAIVFVVINVHYPAGAWNAKKNERAEADRMEGWKDMFGVHKARVKYWHDKGVTVFWVGDVNRMDMPKVHPKEVQVVTKGIDSISYIEGNVLVKAIRTGVIILKSDHNAHWAVFHLSP